MLSQRAHPKRVTISGPSQVLHSPGSRPVARAPAVVCREPHKRALVLDLDETLIYSCKFPPHGRSDCVRFDQGGETFYTFKRPGLDDFIERMSELYEIYIYTSSDRLYAAPVIDAVCPTVDEGHRLYRQSCRIVAGCARKNLLYFRRPLEEVVLVDDDPDALRFYPKNALLVEKWFGTQHDTELTDRVPGILKECVYAQNIQGVLRTYAKTKHSFCASDSFYPSFNTL